jgi:hypothetical protein
MLSFDPTTLVWARFPTDDTALLCAKSAVMVVRCTADNGLQHIVRLDPSGKNQGLVPKRLGFFLSLEAIGRTLGE